ncbi:MAG: aminoglycoside phosphotransferase family protein [Actinomycetia bacterium]|nr:aminoglycoside phosphotransferase family protein [Actinomycetes bacterium]
MVSSAGLPFKSHRRTPALSQGAIRTGSWINDSTEFVQTCLDQVGLARDTVVVDSSGHRSLVIVSKTQQRVYRFPREANDAAEIADYGKRHELSAALGLPVPRWYRTHLGRPGEAFLELELIGGNGLDHPMVVGLAARRPVAVGRQFAYLLLQLRAISATLWPLPRIDLTGLWDDLAIRVRELEGHVPNDVYEAMDRAALAAIVANRSAHLGLVHGDLGGVNARFSELGRLTGVLDWDGAGIADVAADAAAVSVGLPPEARAVLFQTAPVIAEDAARCQAYVDTWTAQGALWALANDDEHGLNDMIRRERERMAKNGWG